MASKAVKALAYVVSAVMVFFGVVFMLANAFYPVSFIIGVILIALTVGLLFAIRDRKPVEIHQTVTVTGPVKGTFIRCPNCGANVDPMTAKVVEGKPYVMCDHCGTRFELTEEPTW